jgi:hypothetical protein
MGQGNKRYYTAGQACTFGTMHPPPRQLVGEKKEFIKEVHNIGQELSEIAKELTFEFDRIIKAIKHTDMR